MCVFKGGKRGEFDLAGKMTVCYTDSNPKWLETGSIILSECWLAEAVNASLFKIQEISCCIRQQIFIRNDGRQL